MANRAPLAGALVALTIGDVLVIVDLALADGRLGGNWKTMHSVGGGVENN